MNEQLYVKKASGRYRPIGYSDGFSGFPSSGIWLVSKSNKGSSSECIIKYEDLETARPAVQLILEYKDKIIDYLHKHKTFSLHNICMNDFVSDMLKEITKETE